MKLTHSFNCACLFCGVSTAGVINIGVIKRCCMDRSWIFLGSEAGKLRWKYGTDRGRQLPWLRERRYGRRSYKSLRRE